MCYNEKGGDILFTISDVISMYSVTRRTVYRWIKEGAPFEKLGSKWYLRNHKILEEWLKERGR